jgi:dCMP deaminase
MTRLTKENYYLNIAEAVSKRSTCIRAQCGAIIVNKDGIISTGYNGNPRSVFNCCDVGTCPRASFNPSEGTHLCNSVHGEMNCLMNLCRHGGASTVGATMFVWFKRLDTSINTYNKPCNSCCKHLINAGIKYIVLYTEDQDKICLDVSEINDGIITTDRVSETIKVPKLSEGTDVKS